jgi:prepilin-type N-terminal cleavage/methylation domain-containing protein
MMLSSRQNWMSLHHRSYSERGFSLIEITIALSILVLALSILVENQGFAAFMTRDAEKIRIATMLAEEKMIEAQLHLELEGWKTSDIDEDGDFDDLGSEEFRGSGSNLDLDDEFEDYKWAYTIRKIEMNMPADMGGMMDDMMGSGYYGDQSQNEAVQDNQMDLGDIGISSDMITEYLSDYIREVRVMVWWEEDFEESGDYVELLTHVVNPSGVVTDPEVEETQ